MVAALGATKAEVKKEEVRKQIFGSAEKPAPAVFFREQSQCQR
jgi:hypothetical protein